MYRVSLDNFEGPLDLLLFFIKRDEIDIYDIPISHITEEFLGYIRFLEELDIDVASEFILMASTLMAIKAKMLIPQVAEADQEELYEIDPRFELTQRLLQYKRFKEMAGRLREYEKKAAYRYRRGFTEPDKVDIDQAGEALQEVTVFSLMEAFKHILDHKNEAPPTHRVHKRVTTIEKQTKFVAARIKEIGRCTFKKLIEVIDDKVVLVTTFLAVLEMIKEEKLFLYATESPHDFELELPSIA